jgi:hypothetical protein
MRPPPPWDLFLRHLAVALAETRLGEHEATAVKTKDTSTAPASSAPAVPPLEALPPVSYFALYRYANYWERVLLVVAAMCALAHGASWPVWALFFGEAVGKFDPNNLSIIVEEIRKLALMFVYTGIAVGFCSIVHVFAFSTMGSRLTARARYHYVKAVSPPVSLREYFRH